MRLLNLTRKNTKKHPETQIKNIAESIKQFGFIQPVVLDNKLNESEWDDDLIRLELEDLDFGDLDVDFGLDFEKEKDIWKKGKI